jgi:hypothetical protein
MTQFDATSLFSPDAQPVDFNPGLGASFADYSSLNSSTFPLGAGIESFASNRFGGGATDNSFLPLGTGFSGTSPAIAGSYMDKIGRYGVTDLYRQQVNSSKQLPGASTTLPTSPESTNYTNPFGRDQAFYDFVERDRRQQREYELEDMKMLREMMREANTMGQWNTVIGSLLKDIPKALSEPARRRNMYLGDMLKSQADMAREQAVGIKQALASMPAAPARNYIRI